MNANNARNIKLNFKGENNPVTVLNGLPSVDVIKANPLDYSGPILCFIAAAMCLAKASVSTFEEWLGHFTDDTQRKLAIANFYTRSIMLVPDDEEFLEIVQGIEESAANDRALLGRYLIDKYLECAVSKGDKFIKAFKALSKVAPAHTISASARKYRNALKSLY